MVSALLMWMVLVLPFQVGVSGWRHGGRAPQQEHQQGRTTTTTTTTSHNNHHHQHHHHNYNNIHHNNNNNNQFHHHHRVLPEQQNNTVVVAQLGGTATIRCYTHLQGNDMVNWHKHDSDQILTTGAVVYSSEPRLSITHTRHQKMWQLSVSDVRLSDAGVYSCQFTSHPPASLFFTLEVVEARAVVAEGAAVYVHTGGRLRLHCRVELATEPPQYIFWFHNGTMINYSPRRPTIVRRNGHSTSLVIANVTWEDAGWYRCEPHLAKSANLTLHVLEGEKRAALHNGHKDSEQEVSNADNSGHHVPTTPLIGPLCLLIFLWWTGSCLQLRNDS